MNPSRDDLVEESEKLCDEIDFLKDQIVESVEIIKALCAMAPPVESMDALEPEHGLGRLYNLGPIHEDRIRQALAYLERNIK